MHRSRPMALGGLLATIVLLLAACGGGTDSAGEDDSGETVSLSGGQFSPSTLTIPVGTTVTFTDSTSHTVTEGSNGVAVDDPIVDADGSSDPIVVSFDEAGSFDITCKIHPAMNMTVTVEG